MVYNLLSKDSPIRKLCDKEKFYISDRPIDLRDKNYTSHFRDLFAVVFFSIFDVLFLISTFWVNIRRQCGLRFFIAVVRQTAS